uniref:ATP synthase F0 subunit 8 n=1 Tax=Liposcelis entomophila TaxID=550478 RepID=A0A096X708_9NEOP|nr:ATP synthase F0 subunit 8 [Liposcelis entomophila]AHA47081.1 ATP synthase F0 subunit 8 [Liposcelis entomophila]
MMPPIAPLLWIFFFILMVILLMIIFFSLFFSLNFKKINYLNLKKKNNTILWMV